MSGGASFNLRIALLSGGDSDEREVSLISGQQVAAALQTAGHRVELFDPAEIPLTQINWDDFDGCFIALHGGAGEDGRVQRELENLNVLYTGSGPAASQLAMNKAASKYCFTQYDLQTPPSFTVHLHELECQQAGQPLEARIEQQLQWPVVIKPNCQGSSLGVVIVNSPADLPEKFAQAAEFDSTLLVEKFMSGRELTVSVINGHPLPVLEIITPSGRYDYEAKYHRNDTIYRFDLGLPDTLIQKIRETAITAAKALGTRGLVRVDIILDEDNIAWVLEVNTIPGMTQTSLSPKAAQAAGMSMPEFCDRLVQEFLIRKFPVQEFQPAEASG